MRTVRWWPLTEGLRSEQVFTGERFTIDQSGEIRVEHLHRYLWAGSLHAGGRWIDAASGSGYGTYLLSTPSRAVTGFDINPAAVQDARRVFNGESLDFEVGSVYSLGIESGSVDVAVSFETIEHVSEPRRAVSEFARCLRSTGRLVASSPNKAVYSSNRPPHNDFHRFEYYAEEFREELEREFANVQLFGQWAVGATSIIAPLTSGGSWENNSFWLNGQFEGVKLDATYEPRYFIAVASNSEVDTPRLPSIAIDSFDVEVTQETVERLRKELADLELLLERERVKALADIEAVRRDVSDLMRLNQHLEDKLAMAKRELSRFIQDK